MEAAEIKQANQDFSVKLNRHLKQLTERGINIETILCHNIEKVFSI